jgi:hypothetical protein
LVQLIELMLALALALAKLHFVSSVLNQMALVCVCGAPLPLPPSAHGLGAFSVSSGDSGFTVRLAVGAPMQTNAHPMAQIELNGCID